MKIDESSHALERRCGSNYIMILYSSDLRMYLLSAGMGINNVMLTVLTNLDTIKNHLFMSVGCIPLLSKLCTGASVFITFCGQ